MSTFQISVKSSPSESAKVVITGLGAVTSIGNNMASFWKNLVAGVSGANQFDGSDYSVNIACEVKAFKASDFMSSKEARHQVRASQFAIAAALEALADSKLEIGMDVAPERLGVAMNTGGGGIGEIEGATRKADKLGINRISPFLVPMAMPNAVSAAVALKIGAQGPALTTTLACASGSYALVEAAHLIKRGEADVVIAGGSESIISAVFIAGLSKMGALSKWEGDPTLASRPFDANRDGFVFGEGAAAVVLETEAHAAQRGAPIYAEVLGGLLTADAYHITAPDPDGRGAARAIAGAIQQAGVSPGDVDVIFAHGTSTPLNDATETRAIKRVFGRQAYNIPVTATKSMIGHTMGAAGAISAVAAVRSMAEELVPPTINYEQPDPECDLDYVPNEQRRLSYETALINAFGFGGHNVALLLRRYS